MAEQRQNLSKTEKPDKPYPSFPLFSHRNGQWCRKIRGKKHYFGPWDDWKAALERHNKEYPYLKAGMSPPETYDGLTTAQVCNSFLTHKMALLESGEISERWFQDISKACEVLLESVGKQRIAETLQPADFEKLRKKIVQGKSPTVAKNMINRIRSIFKFAEENDLVERRIKFGTGFKPPSKAVIRKHRNTKPKKLFSAADVRKLIDGADTTMAAMVLLAMNAGLNNTDICELQFSHLDLETDWADYPRTKTGINRRFKLWPETIAKLKAAIEERYEPHSKDDAGYVFITTFGNSWHPRNSLAKEFSKLRDQCNVAGSFQYFRHTFETIAGGSKDQVAVDHIMGHVDNSMASEYRERIEDERLEAVSSHVQKWLGLDSPE